MHYKTSHCSCSVVERVSTNFSDNPRIFAIRIDVHLSIYRDLYTNQYIVIYIRKKVAMQFTWLYTVDLFVS